MCLLLIEPIGIETCASVSLKEPLVLLIEPIGIETAQVDKMTAETQGLLIEPIGIETLAIRVVINVSSI